MLQKLSFKERVVVQFAQIGITMTQYLSHVNAVGVLLPLVGASRKYTTNAQVCLANKLHM
jgi:hypothetical protein